MNQATEVYARTFDATFLGLPAGVRAQIEAKIGDLGRRLETSRITDCKAGQNSGSAWATTGSSTNWI